MLKKIRSNVNLIHENNGSDIMTTAAAASAATETGDNTDKVIVYMGDGWCTFPDLDHFDSDRLLKALTLKEADSADSVWDPIQSYTSEYQSQQRLVSLASSSAVPRLSISSLRQLEALFNLTQLLFGLSRAETVNFTFRDLQFKRHPHSFKKSGFKKLTKDTRVDFYMVFEELVKDIIDQGGLEIALLMYRTPRLPMVRQKCLDLITNVATVPNVAHKILLYQSWFLDHLLIMIRDGDIVSDKIPALSVLIRLLKVMLTERMKQSYVKLVDMQYIDFIVDIFENTHYLESNDTLPFFIKFEFIAMQSLTVILGDREYIKFWSEKAKSRLLNYCMIVLLKAAGVNPVVKPGEKVPYTAGGGLSTNHITYAEKHTNKHSLAHTIISITELMRDDENMLLFYRHHKHFKRLLIELYRKYGAKSEYILIDPGVSYALHHLMRVLYLKKPRSGQQTSSKSSDNLSDTLLAYEKPTNAKNMPKLESYEASTFESKVALQSKKCSNFDCANEETKFKAFKKCTNCDGRLASYCSSKCRNAHLGYHLKNECQGAVSNAFGVVSGRVKATTSSSEFNRNAPSLVPISKTLSTLNAHPAIGKNFNQPSNLQLNPIMTNGQINRRASDNLQYKIKYTKPLNLVNDDDFLIQKGDAPHQSLSRTKRLSKYTSMSNENRRNSLNLVKTRRNDVDAVEADTQAVELYELRSKSNENNLADKPPHHYAKHTNSMKEIKSSRLNSFDNDDIRSRISNSRNPNNNDNSTMNFAKPLKTSTALCLPDLTDKRPVFQPPGSGNSTSSSTLSSSSGMSSSSSSSAEPTNIPYNSNSKRFKANNGARTDAQKSTHHKERINEEEKPNMDSKPSSSSHKRRHSATASIQTTTKTTTTTQITKTKIKAVEMVDDVTDDPNAFKRDTNNMRYSFKRKQSKGPTLEKETKYTGDFFYTNQQQRNQNDNDDSPASSSSLDDENDNDSSSLSENSDSSGQLSSSSFSSIFSNMKKPDNDRDDDQTLGKRAQREGDDMDEDDDDDDDEDDIEAERWATGTDLRGARGGSNGKIESLESSELFESVNNTDQQPKLKIINEFERTLQLLTNYSNLKAPASDSAAAAAAAAEKSSSDTEVKQHHPGLSFDNLVYDRNESLARRDVHVTNESISDASSYVDNKARRRSHLDVPKEQGRFSRAQKSTTGVNLIINNSVGSELAATYKESQNHENTQNQTSGDQTEIANDMNKYEQEMSMFKNDTLLDAKSSDYKTFKIPLMPAPQSINNLPLSIRPIDAQPNEYLFKKNKVFNELKVFSNISHLTNVQDQSSIHPSELPKNSTPILTDNTALAILNAKRKQILNAKLDLTIQTTNQSAPPPQPQHQQQPVYDKQESSPQLDLLERANLMQQLTNSEPTKPMSAIKPNENRRSGNFLLPKLSHLAGGGKQSSKASQAAAQSKADTVDYRTSTLKSTSTDQGGSGGGQKASKQLEQLPIIEKKSANTLDISKLSAIENVVTSTNVVGVPKVDMPKGLRHCIKEEIRRDKKSCIIS